MHALNPSHYDNNHAEHDPAVHIPAENDHVETVPDEIQTPEHQPLGGVP